MEPGGTGTGRAGRARLLLAAGWAALAAGGAGTTWVLDAEIAQDSARYGWSEYAPEREGPLPTPAKDLCAPPQIPAPWHFRVCPVPVAEPDGIPSRWATLEEARTGEPHPGRREEVSGGPGPWATSVPRHPYG
ncbi:hypothetical protein ACFSJS_15260 [Streptomyces desertarenae]|uniref:Uncharacterized protein n=1 Tax=Streptomyces desertarenae TaxID=2666184 RepID=A0ABW4PLD2_9ACTN